MASIEDALAKLEAVVNDLVEIVKGQPKGQEPPAEAQQAVTDAIGEVATATAPAGDQAATADVENPGGPNASPQPPAPTTEPAESEAAPAPEGA